MQRARLDRRAGDAVVDDPPLDHDVGLGPRRVHVAAADRPLVHLVGAEVGVDERLGVVDRLLGIDDDRQRVVLDEHLLGGVDDAVLVVAEDDRDALADVLDLALGERPVLGRLDLDARRHPGHRQAGGDVEVLAGEDAVHAGQLPRAGGVDRDDLGVRLGRADDGHVEHAGDDHVVDVAPAAGDHPRVLLAPQRLADPLAVGARLLGDAHSVTSWPAADSTALTMLW